MASFNRITIYGNLGADPEINTVSDRKVAKFNLATNKKYTTRQGERVEETTWFRVAVWGRQADVVEQYLKKGDPVFVEGELSTRYYVNQEGKDRTSLEVTCRNLQLMPKNNANQNSGNYQASPAPQQQPAQPQAQPQPAQTSQASPQPGNTGNDGFGTSGSQSDETDDLPF